MLGLLTAALLVSPPPGSSPPAPIASETSPAADDIGCTTSGPWSRGHFLLRPALGFASEKRGPTESADTFAAQVAAGVVLRLIRCKNADGLWSYNLESTVSYGVATWGSPRQTLGLGVMPAIDTVWATVGPTVDVLVARRAGETAVGARLGVAMKAFAGLVILQGGIELFPRGFPDQIVVTVGTDIELLVSKFGPSDL